MNFKGQCGHKGFRKLYECTWRPDLAIDECIALLRKGRGDIVSALKKDGYFSEEQVRGARYELEKEGRDNICTK